MHMHGKKPEIPKTKQAIYYWDDVSFDVTVVTSVLHWLHHTFDTGVFVFLILC